MRTMASSDPPPFGRREEDAGVAIRPRETKNKAGNMAAKKGDYQIPFDEDGNQLHYPEIWIWGQDGKRQEVQWRDNERFATVLTYDNFYRGRSAAGFVFKDPQGHCVTFFMRDFEDIIPHMKNGEVDGTFEFIKRGANYGCRIVKVSV